MHSSHLCPLYLYCEGEKVSLNRISSKCGCTNEKSMLKSCVVESSMFRRRNIHVPYITLPSNNVKSSTLEVVLSSKNRSLAFKLALHPTKIFRMYLPNKN